MDYNCSRIHIINSNKPGMEATIDFSYDSKEDVMTFLNAKNQLGVLNKIPFDVIIRLALKQNILCGLIDGEEFTDEIYIDVNDYLPNIVESEELLDNKILARRNKQLIK